MVVDREARRHIAEVDRGGNQKSRRTRQLRRHPQAPGAEIGHSGVDDKAEQSNSRERAEMFRHSLLCFGNGGGRH